MYVTLGSRGEKIFSVTDASLIQKETQANAGGLTDIYLDVGTYVKSFLQRDDDALLRYGGHDGRNAQAYAS